MRPLHVRIRPIGNSQAVIIAKPVPSRLGMNDEAGAATSPSIVSARTGWAEAAKKIAEAAEDHLALGEFGNAADLELVW